MGRYRRKPEVVEASRWLEHGDHPAVSELPANRLNFTCLRCNDPSTNHGMLPGPLSQMRIVCPGDWVIT